LLHGLLLLNDLLSLDWLEPLLRLLIGLLRVLLIDLLLSGLLLGGLLLGSAVSRVLGECGAIPWLLLDPLTLLILLRAKILGRLLTSLIELRIHIGGIDRIVGVSGRIGSRGHRTITVDPFVRAGDR